MPLPLLSRPACFAVCSVAALTFAVTHVVGQQPPAQFGGAYSALDARRQHFVEAWVTRFAKATGQKLDAAHLYDDLISMSSKTTFEAITHALMTTPLTDAAGASLGDALTLVERVESVRGEIAGESGDRQFRMYSRLTPEAVDTLGRSQQFRRRADNSIYHKGYPINFRQQGKPSIQISIARDGRRADIDVDYRSSSFPVAMFNGHLSAANSDVRAGDNYDRHANRWTGFQNWWRGFFGARLKSAPEDTSSRPLALPKTPRAGDKSIDAMVYDFLQAWLIEGDVVATMGYVSERAYACLAQDSDDPSDFDRGMAPFQLMTQLKAARDELGQHSSLDGLTVGTRLERPALRVVRQPHDAQFVIYAVPDDVAAAFDCESQLTPGDARKGPRVYGHYYGATFLVSGRKDHTIALLWAKEDGYWKLVSWKTGEDEKPEPVPPPPAERPIVKIKADPTVVAAARGFLDSWLIRKNYDAAFAYFSPASYACYDLVRSPETRASSSPAEAGQRIRAGLEGIGKRVGEAASLDAVLSAVQPFDPAIRVMDHPDADTFTLSSVPNVIADAVGCAARARNEPFPTEIPLEYSNVFGTTVRFRTRSGDPPVLRLLWRKEGSDLRITAFDLEVP
jgi:hypothetical protein